VYLIIHPRFLYALLVLNKSMKMIKIDRNMWQLWQIVFKNIIFNINAFLGALL
jgi:hypothetical protein